MCALPIVARRDDERVCKVALLGNQLAPVSGLRRGYGGAHHVVHNVPLARLVFTPKDYGSLHRCAIDAIEAGHNVASGDKEAEGEHERISVADAAPEARA